MSALVYQYGFKLTTLLEAQRGMTEAEAYKFLATGAVPDFSQPGAEPDAEPVLDDTQVLPSDTIKRWLAGEEPTALVATAGFFANGSSHGAPWHDKTVTLKFNPGQPRDDDGRWTDGGVSGVGVMDKLTPEQITKRGKGLDQILREARDLATDRTHATRVNKKDVVWSPERDKQHREIVEDVYQRASNVPNDGRAIIMGGPMGAGKTTTLRDHAGIDTGNYLLISPDDMKDELINRGLVPNIPDHPELSPLELSTLVHTETLRLAEMLAQRAYRDKKNVIWDTSMASQRVTGLRIDALDGFGYGHISSIVVDVPPHVSRARAYARYTQGIQDWQNGKGNGGRYIPRSVLDTQHDERGVSWGRDTLRAMKSDFDAWMVYDNSVDGRAPKLIGKSGDIAYE